MIRIAVADDEPLARYNILSILREQFTSINVIEAENGLDLIRLIQGNQVDIALVDIRMPRMDGLEAMMRCENRSDIPWAIVSSYADFPYAKKAIELGAQGYILKPPDPTEVRDVTTDLIKKFQKIKEAQIERLETWWHKRLENLEAAFSNEPLETNSEPMFLIKKNMNSIVPYIISLQGPTLPQKAIKETIQFYCKIDSEDNPFILLYPNNDYGYYEIAYPVKTAENASHWKDTGFNHLFARLQHDFSLYQIKMLIGSLCSSLETAARQIKKIRDLLNFAPLLPNACIDLEHASQILQPYTSNELEAARLIVTLTRSWHRKDWISCKNHVYDLYIKFEKVEKRLQHQLIQNLEKSLYIETSLTQYLLKDSYLDETRQELLCLIQQNEKERQKDPFTEILRFIDMHFAESISLSQVAAIFGFSPNYLSAIFHQRTGTTYTSYITNLRIKEARNLLRSGVSVKETAWAVGYMDEQHFARLYKKIMGISPGQDKKS
ncbi:response regulator [Gracilinema caldarium]|uniref:response regulator transcription factor n=1 Tax=Gracilinema caldarium TaxID=215591 RepID=UPI0026EED889|nr:response regulator [Gracilinema caldarium]